jgi:hypothetical protein
MFHEDSLSGHLFCCCHGKKSNNIAEKNEVVLDKAARIYDRLLKSNRSDMVLKCFKHIQPYLT